MYKGAREEKKNAVEICELHHILVKYLSNICNHADRDFFRKISWFYISTQFPAEYTSFSK